MKTLLLGSLLMGATMLTNAQNLIFGTEPSYPPFELTNEKGDLVGFDIDIAQAICKEIQVTCQFKTQPFDALIPSLKAKHGFNYGKKYWCTERFNVSAIYFS